MQIITTQVDLQNACVEMASCKTLAIDTEYMRDTTYWAKLCLIQVAAGEHIYLIDPLVETLDLAPFFAVIEDERIEKIFHAGRHDIEILYHRTGTIPTPVFDTQIIAMVCGFGEQISYSGLVKALLGEKIDKSEQYTDWSKRPLSEAQCAYAASDVLYLEPMRDHLMAQLHDDNRGDWIQEELAALIAPETYDLAPENAWKRFKPKQWKPQMLGVLICLAAWREREAQRSDVPRGRVMRDHVMTDIALRAPSSPDALAQLRSVAPSLAHSRRGEEILEIVQQGRALSKTNDLPDLPPQRRNRNDQNQALLSLLTVLLRHKANHFRVAVKLIASSADLEAFADGDQTIPFMSGWRHRIFGHAALDLVTGKIALTAHESDIVVIDLPLHKPPPAPSMASSATAS